MATIEARKRARAKYLQTHRLVGVCKHCGNEFNKPYRSRPYTYCSGRCRSLNKASPGTIGWRKPVLTYSGLHTRIRAELGTPRICENCNKEVLNQGIHWANISGEYKKDHSDWIRLCASCHKKYDLKLIKLGVKNGV